MRDVKNLSREEKEKLLSKIEEMKKNGTSIEAACQSLGLRWNLYYSWKKTLTAPTPPPVATPEARVIRRRNRKSPALIPLPEMPKSERIVAIIGSPQEVMTFIRGYV